MQNIQLGQREVEYLSALLQDRYYKITNLDELSLISCILASLGNSPITFISQGQVNNE